MRNDGTLICMSVELDLMIPFLRDEPIFMRYMVIEEINTRTQIFLNDAHLVAHHW